MIGPVITVAIGHNLGDVKKSQLKQLNVIT